MNGNLELDTTGSRPLLARANLERMRGNWNEAVDTCLHVLHTEPGNADAHALLGNIYSGQGSLDEAIYWYRLAADLRPTGPDIDKLRKLERERIFGQRDRDCSRRLPPRVCMTARMQAPRSRWASRLNGGSIS